MTAVYDTAIDEIFTAFNDAWILNAAAIVGYLPDVRWPGIEEPEKPPKEKFWARASTKSIIEEQATLSDCVGTPGKKHFNTSGFVFIQLFCPKSVANSTELGRKLAIVARNSFRGKSTPNKVWFRNATINSLDPEALFYRFNVVTEYHFDEIG